MRARNIKPDFFHNDDLAECTPLARILFAGLWCYCDREGRAEYKPKRIKKEILGYDNCDINALLGELEKYGFIIKYSVDEKEYLYIKNFSKHQKPHHQEKDSTLPAPVEAKTEPLRTKVRTTSHQGTSNNALIADRGLLIEDRGKMIADRGLLKDEEKYSFEGKIIKLNPDDYNRWKKQFPYIGDFDGTLAVLDAWYQNPKNQGARKSWFFQVPSMLKKDNEKQKEIEDAQTTVYSPELRAKADAYAERVRKGEVNDDEFADLQ